MSKAKSKKGMVLFIVLAFTCILTIIAFATLSIATGEITLTQQYINKTRAFYLAEAALAKFSANTGSDIFVSIDETWLGDGTYEVDYHYEGDPPYAIATGSARGKEKKLKVNLSFLAPPYECSAYAGNMDGINWDFILGGTGEPTTTWSGNYNGKDIVNGNVFAGGDVHLYGESSINPAPAPNPFLLQGDVEATGTVNVHDSASISGDELEGVEPYNPPDLIGMNYATNHTHNVSQAFEEENVTHGTLSEENVLYNIFQINPDNMTSECATTDGNDYFLTTVGNFTEGSWDTAESYIDVGEDRVYYIDGDLWVHSKSTFGFNVDGKVTIVATGDIHLSDNLAYENSNSMLGLVALGKYDESGNLISGGNVYFGDPVYGTLYTASAMMFAANNFLYNTDPISATTAEPESGFVINGSMIAMNQVSIERDWYTESTSSSWPYTANRQPCRYDPDTSQWIDSETETPLTQDQIDSIKHYRMILNYDDRVRSPQTQPLGLPRGEGTIFDGLCDWEEYTDGS